jgi:hypothetical protein
MTLPAGAPAIAPPQTCRPPSRLAEDPLATSLADALTHLEPDAIWERALSTATSLSA